MEGTDRPLKRLKIEKRARIDYVEDLGQARAFEVLQKWITEHEGFPLEAGLGLQPEQGHKWVLDLDTGCWLLTSGISSGGQKQKPGSGRYGVIKLNTNGQIRGKSSGVPIQRNSGKNFQWHVVAYLAKTGKNVEFDASHICGWSVCFNPSHVEDENHETNLSRNRCLGQIWCSIHDNLVLDLCEHKPKCIQPYIRDDIPFFKCCLSHEDKAQSEADTFQTATSCQGLSVHPLSRQGSEPAKSDSEGWGNLSPSFLQERSSASLSESETSSEPDRRKKFHQSSIQTFLSQDPKTLSGVEALIEEKETEFSGDPSEPLLDSAAEASDQHSGASVIEDWADQFEEMAAGL